MIAIIGLPGSRHHNWERFGTRAECEKWIEDFGREYFAVETAAYPQPTRIMSEKDAAKIRYRDGRRCYPVGAEIG